MPLTPPRDAAGNTQPHNDPNIADQGYLIRHINPVEHVIFDENINAKRITSGAFSCSSRDPHYGMSVDIGQLLAEENLAESHMVPAGMGAVRMNVGDVRKETLRVGSDPVLGNAFHGQVWDVKSSKGRKLHRLVQGWVTPIKDVQIR